MRRYALLCALLISPVAWSQVTGEQPKEDAPSALACASSADVEGLAALENQCPGLQQELQDLGYLDLISAEGQALLAPAQLAELQQIVTRYERETIPVADPGAVAPILESLQLEEPEERPGLWQRMVRWLRDKLRQQAEGNEWLNRWLPDPESARVAAQWILIGAIVLTVLGAAIVLFIELRAAGVFGKATRKRTAGSVPADGSSAKPLSLSDLDSTPADEQATLLLRLLIARLTESGRLPSQQSLTHRELGECARFDHERQQDVFRRIAALAERAVYGASAAASPEQPAVLAAGRELYERIGAARA